MPIDFSDYLERSGDTSPSSAGFSIQGGRAVRTLVVKMTPTTEDAQSWYRDIGNFFYVNKGVLQYENDTGQAKWKPMWRSRSPRTFSSPTWRLSGLVAAGMMLDGQPESY
jgi:hypothetical protein